MYPDGSGAVPASSPMQMSLTNYMTSIGPKYLIIPAVTIGMGYMALNKTS